MPARGRPPIPSTNRRFELVIECAKFTAVQQRRSEHPSDGTEFVGRVACA
jgi:hypothetical protein